MGLYTHGAVSLQSSRIPWPRKHSSRVLTGAYFDALEAGETRATMDQALVTELRFRNLIP